jgi:hypothetical protein
MLWGERHSLKEDEMARIIRIILGSFLIVLGVAGLFLPILQGWLFLALGVLLLSVDIPVFNRLVCRIGNRFPGRQGVPDCRLWTHMCENGSNTQP